MNDIPPLGPMPLPTVGETVQVCWPQSLEHGRRGVVQSVGRLTQAAWVDVLFNQPFYHFNTYDVNAVQAEYNLQAPKGPL